jgi:putative DNA primase/helicase
MRRDDHGNNDIARVAGARLILANETRTDQQFDDLTIKTLVSREPIAARFLYQETFQFLPTGKVWVRGNHRPIVADDSDGIWRRIRLVPFTQQVPDAQVDSDLEEKLFAEAPGILSWMVEGAVNYVRDGLRPTRSIQIASNAYRSECDLLGEWIEDDMELGPAFKIRQDQAFSSYENWCGRNNLRATSKKVFTRKLGDRGFGVGWMEVKKRAYVGLQKRVQS